jgi:hypothetical protein
MGSLIAYVKNGEEDLYRASSDVRPCWANWLLYDKASIDNSLSAFDKSKNSNLQKSFRSYILFGKGLLFDHTWLNEYEIVWGSLVEQNGR